MKGKLPNKKSLTVSSERFRNKKDAKPQTTELRGLSRGWSILDG